MSFYKGIYLFLFICFVILDMLMSYSCIMTFSFKFDFRYIITVIFTFLIAVPSTFRLWRIYKSYDDDNKTI